MAQFEPGVIVAIIWGGIAVVFFGRGWIRTINTAYRESTLQGRLCMFPLYAIYYAIRREHSGLKSVITEFMKAGAARNVEAAYACCSLQSAAKEEIAGLIGSSSNVFAGYERLTIGGLQAQSDGGSTEACVSGAIIYTGGKRMPFKASLVKENDVWKIINMQIGSTEKVDIVRRLSISLGGPPGPGR